MEGKSMPLWRAGEGREIIKGQEANMGCVKIKFRAVGMAQNNNNTRIYCDLTSVLSWLGIISDPSSSLDPFQILEPR